MTKYEKQIYEIVNKLTGHMTADQIFFRTEKKSYPSVSLATVYNNLNKLCEAGLIRRVSTEGAPDRVRSDCETRSSGVQKMREAYGYLL